MATTGKEFVEFARSMLNSSSGSLSEIQLRTIINRAYYGAHHEAKLAANIDDGTHDCHKVVIKHYEDAKMRLIANKLDELFKVRKKADYDVHLDALRTTESMYKTAQISCSKAYSILTELAAESAK